jgi:hypothetical protein
VSDISRGSELTVSQSIESENFLVRVHVEAREFHLRVERAGRLSLLGLKARYVACYQGWQLRKVKEYVEILDSVRNAEDAQDDGTALVRCDQGPQEASDSTADAIELTLDDPPARGLVLLRQSGLLDVDTASKLFRGRVLTFSFDQAGGTDPVGV